MRDRVPFLFLYILWTIYNTYDGITGFHAKAVRCKNGKDDGADGRGDDGNDDIYDYNDG